MPPETPSSVICKPTQLFASPTGQPFILLNSTGTVNSLGFLLALIFSLQACLLLELERHFRSRAGSWRHFGAGAGLWRHFLYHICLQE